MTESSNYLGAVGSADAGATDDPAAIRAEIRDTRDRLGDTLEQISGRLNPTNIKEQVKEQVTENVTQLTDHVKEQVRETVRNSPIGKVGIMAQSAVGRVTATQHGIVDSIRDNPIPAALIGLGLSWLLINRRNEAAHKASSGSAYADARYSVPTRPSYGGSTSGAYQGQSYDAGYGAGYTGSQAGSQGSAGLADRASGAVADARERVGGTVENVRDSAGQLVDRAQDVASNVAEQTRYRARRVEDQFFENPLVFGAGALLTGLALGLAAPATSRENELFGETRDRLVDRAKEAAEEAKDQAQQVATRVVSEVKTVATDAMSQAQAGQGGQQQGGQQQGGQAQGGQAQGGKAQSGQKGGSGQPAR